MRLIRFYIRYAPKTMILGMLVGIVSGVGSAALMAVINNHLSGVASANESSPLKYAGLVLVVLLSSYASRTMMAYLCQWAICDLRLHLCRRLVEMPLSDFEAVGGARAMAGLTEDIDYLARVLLNIPLFFIDIAVCIACCIYLGWLSLPVFMFFLAFIAVAIFISKAPEYKARNYLSSAREDVDALLGHFRSLTDGVKELKLHRARRESFFAGPLHKTTNSYRRNRFISEHRYGFARSCAQVMYFLFVGICLYGLPRLTNVGDAVLLAFIVTLLFMKPNIDRIQDLLPLMAQGQISLRKIEALGLSIEQMGNWLTAFGETQAEEQPAQASADVAVLPAPQGQFHRLELVGVTHRYYREQEERNFSLGPISLTIENSELIFIVGGNGCGKTTLAKLVSGLYVPESGEIRLDGCSITDENREWYRQHYTVVFSDFHLFESLFGLGTGSARLDSKAREYLVQLQLDHKVRVESGVLSTISLSQGQRKRLALMTAFLEDRPIYIFDEWAADQDPMFKKVFYYSLLPELKARGKTILVISHDDQYYHIADRIVKMDFGKIEHIEYAKQVVSAVI